MKRRTLLSLGLIAMPLPAAAQVGGEAVPINVIAVVIARNGRVLQRIKLRTLEMDMSPDGGTLTVRLHAAL